MDDLDIELLGLMSRIGRVMRQHMLFNSELAQLTLLQLDTLVVLNKTEPVQMKDIADNFHITMPTATTLVNKLVELDLVERMADKNDRRIVRLALTKGGKQLLTKTIQEKQKKTHQILSFLSSEDKAHMRRVLETILEKTEKVYEK